MKKICFAIILMLLSGHICFAGKGLEDLLPIIHLTTAEITTDKVTKALGRPEKIEENNRKARWYYNCDDLKITFCWSKKSEKFELISIIRKEAKKDSFDERLSVLLKSGKTDIRQALEILGAPRDMTIKESKQVMHYFYQNNTLRLFFKDNILVDYTLIGQSRYQ